MPPKKKAKTTPNQTTAPQPAPAPPRPNWPAIQSLIARADQSLHTLVPAQILTIPNFWPAKLCKDYVSFLSSLPLTTTPGKPKKGDAVRVNDRFQIDDAVFAERLWSETGLKDLVLGVDGGKELWGGEVVGLNPNIRIYRYTKGQFFDQHYDDSNTVTIPTNPPIKAVTTWTLLLYLTSPQTGCIGGETVFYPEPAKKKQAAPEPVVVELEVGMALLHKHGRDCMLHEGREVLGGEKWVIRSDICVRR